MTVRKAGLSSARDTLPPGRAQVRLPIRISRPNSVPTGDQLNGARRPVEEFVSGSLRRLGHAESEAAWICTTSANEVAAACAAKPAIVDLVQLNNLRGINTFLRGVSSCLPERGIYICCLETLDQRRERIFGKYPRVLAFLFQVITFLLHRVFPKLGATKQIYFWITGGRNRVLSEA
jgi:hypothetical protein